MRKYDDAWLLSMGSGGCPSVVNTLRASNRRKPFHQANSNQKYVSSSLDRPTAAMVPSFARSFGITDEMRVRHRRSESVFVMEGGVAMIALAVSEIPITIVSETVSQQRIATTRTMSRPSSQLAKLSQNETDHIVPNGIYSAPNERTENTRTRILMDVSMAI